MTLLDKWDSFKKEYISRSSSSGSKPKVDPAFQKENYDPAYRKYSSDNLTPERRRKLAYAAPIYIKGIKKKGSDTFRAGLELERPHTRGKAADIDLRIIDNFNKKANLWVKLKLADRCSHIYGDGLILIKYLNDNKFGANGAPDLSLPPNNAKPYDLQVLDPEILHEMRWYETDRRIDWKKVGVQHYFLQAKGGEERYIHPDRILHAPRNQLPFQKLGTSDIDILSDILNSYADINIATGEILKWFSHGIINATKQGITDDQRKMMLEELAKHQNIYVNDPSYEIEIIKAEAIDPRAFYDFILQNIAGVVGMPTHMLTGVVVGRSSGAETGYSDYYRDVSDDQDLIYTPLIRKLYGQLLAAHNREFIYNPIWNQIYIDEKAEAEIDDIRSQSVERLKGAGVIDNKEARQKMNKGFVELDLNKVIKQPPKPRPLGPDKKDVDSNRVK